jgi:hypothetical protein
MPYAARLIIIPAFLSFFLSLACAADSVQMIRSLSGPSGKAIGNRFVLDEVRNRFVYPQDNTLTVYCEFKAPKGDYVLTAYWKDPQGKVAAISPDIKTQSLSDDLSSYWIFAMNPSLPSGIWTVEIRINGEPIGTHSFELAFPEQPKAIVEEVPKAPKLDELYRLIAQSLVWVHKVDGGGHRVNTSSGFVIGQNSILSAFQSIDSATKIEIEFANGIKIATEEVISCSRLQDWALIKVDTGNTPQLQFGKSESIIIGEQLIAFSVGAGGTRTIGVVDIAGRGMVPGFGERIQMNSTLPLMAMGGPLLDLWGRAVGIIGGSLTAGMSYRRPIDLRTGIPVNFTASASTLEGIESKIKSPSRTLKDLLDAGILTPPLSKNDVLAFGAITDNIAPDNSYEAKERFSRRDPAIFVYTTWAKQGKIDKGFVSLKIYDTNNSLRAKTGSQNLKLPDGKIMKYQLGFSPANLEPASYRIDLLWNEVPIWRAFFTIMD